jgi:predicted metalloprotease with PDZ domain
MDENTPNAVVSYYTKGSLIALALDLTIRQHTRNQQSLDDVIRHLWQMYQLTQEGMAENDFDSAIEFIIGPSFQNTWKSFKSDYIEGTKDLPLMKLLSSAKIKVTSKIKKASDSPESAKQLLGIRTTVNNGWIKLTHVLDGGLAQTAGLSAGDYLASIQQERVTASRFDQLLTLLMLEIVNGKNVKILAFRHETAFTVNLSSSPKEMLSRQPEQFSLTVA